MCCIFTCCGWCIDLIQRLWTFTMACCISSAVCCALVTASMSGIALGYNYSLAEYIDLKETNVSVFLKRGVFDDEIADDMDWRRAGHQPVAGHLKDDNLVTGDSDDTMDDTRRSGSVKSGRRMDDNIFQSDDQNRFEGSLMKLTAKPLDPGITTEGPKPDTDMREVAQNYDPGTIDQLKAVQSLINRRKFNLGQMSTQSGDSIPTPILDEKQLANFPPYPGERPYRVQLGDRRIMELQGPHDDSLRNAVPHQEFAAMPIVWGNPKLPPDQRHTAHPDEEVTWPPPVTPRAGPLRPTRPKPAKTPTFPRARTTETALKAVQKKIDEELQMFREGLIKDRLDQQSVNSADFMKSMMGNLPPRPEGAEDYEEDVKGLPVRRRRCVKVSKPIKLTGDTNHTKTDSKFIAEESKLKDASVSKDLSTVLNRVRNFIVTTVSENVLSSKYDPTLNLETSTGKLLVKMMKSTIL